MNISEANYSNKREENSREEQKELDFGQTKNIGNVNVLMTKRFILLVCLNEIVTHAKTTLALIAHSKHNYPNICGNPQMEPSVYIKAKNKTIRNEITTG